MTKAKTKPTTSPETKGAIDITVPSVKPVPRSYEEEPATFTATTDEDTKPHPASYTTNPYVGSEPPKAITTTDTEPSSGWIPTAIILLGLLVLGYVGYNAFNSVTNPPTPAVSQPVQEAPVVIPPTQDSPKVEEAPVGPVKQVDDQPLKVVPMTKEEITKTLESELKQTN